ncbi:hypothetical protein [Megaira polyxenophila phage MAnkyphage_25.80]|nr:hypothetical protein [Megaira polyxenophila phage MAnkyphage_25.80]
MSIDQFTRDAAYFQSRRDSGMLLNAEDMDFQFNNLIDYLNTKIVPIINNFIQEEFIGVNNPALANACLLNIGDGNVGWEKINSNIFPDYSIPLSKFTAISPNCIVWAGNDGRFGYNVASNLNDGILFSRTNTTSVWRKVATGDIANKTLIGGHIALGAIKIEHLGQSLREALFAAPRVILNENIAEAQITEANLQNNSLTAEKLEQQIIIQRQNGITNWNFAWCNDSIENRHIADRVLIGGQGLDSVPTSNGPKYICLQTRYSSPNTDDNTNYTFTSDNIIDESITDTLIGPTPGWGFYTRLLNEYQFENGAIEARHIANGSVWLAGVGQGIDVNNKIPATALDPAIRAKLGV